MQKMRKALPSFITLVLLHFVLTSAQIIFVNDEASVYNGYCYSCIFNGYRYCEDFSVCMTANSICPKGEVNTLSTGCNVYDTCSAYGNQGIGFVGYNNSTQGGMGTDGQVNVNVSSTKPCVMTIVNTAQSDLEVVVQGNKVGALAMTQSFPFNIT